MTVEVEKTDRSHSAAGEGRPLRVLFLSVEVESFAKTGGLGDVAASLPKALRRQGAEVRVCMPRYGGIPERALTPEPIATNLGVPLGDRTEPVGIRLGQLPLERSPHRSPLPMGEGTFHSWLSILDSPPGAAVPVYLVESRRCFGRDNIYGYADDGERFLVYCRAALELCRAIGWAPDVIHCNDWHTAIVPNWLKTIYKDDPFFAKTVTIYTIHNLAYQGVFDYHFLWLAGIHEYGFLYPEIAELADVVDLMGRGILFADAVTTVSERYAREILTPEYGEKLDPLLQDRQERLFGILNGIDQVELDPRTDPHIAANFGPETVERRVENKLALQREAGLPVDPEVPVAGTVGRLSGQKGLDILLPILNALLRRPVQFVLLGTGDPHYEEALRHVERRHPEQVKCFFTFNTPLAQRIYAGSDIFFMPSRYEPCGLGQMIAMRYGSVPVVRATGGLADTVHDWDPRSNEGNGFVFDAYDPLDFFGAATRALGTYKYPHHWRTLQLRGMQGDYSWDRSAAKYLQVYRFALRSKERATRE